MRSLRTICLNCCIIYSMEIPASNATRLFCLYGFLLISLLFSCINADGEIKDPAGNVNLSPFQQWRSAYECLLNTSQNCSTEYTLTMAGWMNVTANDGVDFCKSGGCGEHTKTVLTCIHRVKRDFKFINKAKVPDINFTITHGCDFGFNGTTLISDATRTSKNQIAFLISTLAALSLLMK